MRSSRTREDWRTPRAKLRTSSGVRLGRSRNSANPMTALSGVRISCDIVARNCVRARSPARASFSARDRRTWKTARVRARLRRPASRTPETMRIHWLSEKTACERESVIAW